MAMVQSTGMSRAPRPSSLADVLDLILDKGLVIDAYVRVSLAGIELLTIDARVVVASVDTYLRFAEAVNRLDLTTTESQGLREFFGGRQDDDEEKRSNGSSTGRDGGRDHERDHEEVTGGSDDHGLLGRIAERAKFDR